MLETIRIDEEASQKDATWLMRDIIKEESLEIDIKLINLMLPMAIISILNMIFSFSFLLHSCFFNDIFKTHRLTHYFTYSSLLLHFINFILGMRELHKSQKHNSFIKLLLSTFFVWQLHLSQYSNSKLKSLPTFKKSIIYTYVLQTVPVAVILIVL